MGEHSRTIQASRVRQYTLNLYKASLGHAGISGAMFAKHQRKRREKIDEVCSLKVELRPAKISRILCVHASMRRKVSELHADYIHFCCRDFQRQSKSVS